MKQRSAFTLIEVLIAIALMGIMLPVLYRSVDVLNDSNRDLYAHLQKSEAKAKAMRTLYLDIAGSDGNLSIRKNDYDRLCIAHTTNSLYGLVSPKVCWVVLKKERTLVRIEGVDFHLPLRQDEEIEADRVEKGIAVFDIAWVKDKVVVTIQKQKKDPLTFMVQGITKSKPPKKKKTAKMKKKHKRSTPQKSIPQTNRHRL